MPIIINDGDIMEVLQETPIQSNRISQVKAREYKVSFSFDSGEELSYTQQEDANSIYDDYTYLLVAAYSCDRIEAYYTTGSFQVPFVNFSPSNVHWVINGNRVGSPEGLANYVGPYTDLTGPDSQIGNFSDYDGTSSTFEQTGLWNDGYVDFFNVRIKDNSKVTISTSGNVSTISYKILTKLCAVSRRRTEYSGYIYDGSTITFTVNNSVVSLEDAGIISVGQQTDNILALDDNPLFATSTIYNGISAAAENCMTLRKQWKNGRDSCKIRVIVGEYYDENGDLAISSKESNLPMLFNVGDIVIPYIKIASQYTEDDETYIITEETGISTYSNGAAKRFVVIDEKYVDDGICTQELTLVETGKVENLNDFTWAEIAKISEDGDASEYFNVGDEKTLKLSTGEEITVQILGFNHDDLSDGTGKAGITFGMKNLLTNKYKMNETNTNVGGWRDSLMRNTTMGSIFTLLPSILQNSIKTITKKSHRGGNMYGVYETNDKLWIFSKVEITGQDSQNDVWNHEGSQYEYWTTIKDGSIAENRVKYLSNGTGAMESWWLRSPYDSITVNTEFYIIGGEGKPDFDIPDGDIYLTPAGSNWGICLGFCI